MNDNSNPLVSVVIPTYNHARYLRRALQSVIDQTYINWEAIVIDNHSNDSTDEVMASFAGPRITYLKIHNNGVIAASRNAGIRKAKGEWIAFLDSDDWWTADKLKICCESINHKVDFIYHDLKIISDQPRFFRPKKIKSWQVEPLVLIDLMTRGNAIATSSVLVRKKLLQQLNGMSENTDLVATEDYNTWLRIAQLTNYFRYVPKKLGFYQLHNQGVSQKDMSIPVQHAVADFIDFLNPAQKNNFLANLRYARGRFYYLAGNYNEAKESLFFAIKHGKSMTVLKALWMIILSYFYAKN
jgi:glycosyltransferase involved in cell wall biosynthesis